MTLNGSFALAGLASLFFVGFGAAEAVLAPGGAIGMLAAPATADDDDRGGRGGRGGFDDGGGRGMRGGFGDDDGPGMRGGFDDDDGPGMRGGFDDDDDGPRGRAPRFSSDDDDDDAWAPRARRAEQPRRQAAPRREATPRRRAEPRREAAPRRQAEPRRQAALPEFVAAGVTAEALGRIRAAGFSVLGERRLALLPEATVRVAAPRNLRAARARARLAELAPGAVIDANALYRPNAREGCADGACFPYRVENWTLPVCAARGAVGMIDTRVDASHPALAGRAIDVASTRGEGRLPSSADHGTEVAILLAGSRAEPDDLKVVAVDAFHRTGGSDRADVFDLVAAIDLLAERGAGVVNLSLSGAANEVLDRAGRAAADRGVILVAAVGNDGPKAKPLYPAAYPWAVAVTAVDAQGRAYAKAGRGAHVAFAAPGVRVELPDAQMKPGRQRSGTSYASPLVAATLSALKAEGNGRSAHDIVATLASSVDDVGAPGRDPVFGWGALPQAKGCPSTQRAQSRE